MSRRIVELPEPLPFMAMEIHAALLTAVHAHSAGVVMVTLRDPPAAGTLIVSGATAALQPVCCVTVNTCPPAVMVPVRAVAAFAAAVNCTLPGPFPLAPAVMLIHVALAVAVHAHA
jgi:hypothetical protein